ncbi:MAG TPA: hypothetical protein VK059_14840 [Nocardioidaceae bacterium]|nr:hypothetical protein [Nocardioidaceae bacterium]
MPEEAVTENEAAAESTGDGEQNTEQQTGESPEQTETDWKAKAEGQQKVNRDLERKLKDARSKADRLDEVEAELAKLQGKEQEYAEQQKAREAEQAALSKANERIVRSEIKAAAKGSLADPADAYRFLDVDQFDVDDDGNVDESAIAKAIQDLVTERPYLAAQGGKRFQGSADGGAREGSSKPSQLSRDDLSRMTPEEIDKAHREGRTTDLLNGK